MDAIGRKMDVGEEEYFEPLPGYNVVLTIDETIQHFAEKALNQAMVHSKPSKGAVAIVMDPKTGEILALANRPNFNPNNPLKDRRKNGIKFGEIKLFLILMNLVLFLRQLLLLQL